jgi:hypothetical protein
MVVKVIDRSGELAKVARTLSDAMVNIKNVQLVTKERNIALYLFRVDNVKKASSLLKGYM